MEMLYFTVYNSKLATDPQQNPLYIIVVDVVIITQYLFV